MTTKDAIASWVLVLWVLVTFANSLSAFDEALRVGDSAGNIAWDAFVTIFVATAGIFLIHHYIVKLDDFAHYERLDARERHGARGGADAASRSTDEV